MSSPPASPLHVTYNGETRELIRTVGVVFVGFALSMILYGFNSFQLYVYFSTILEERREKRWVVGILGSAMAFTIKTYKPSLNACLNSLLDSTSVGLMTHFVDYYMILQFPNGLPGVDKATGTFSADNFIAVVTIFLVQLAYLDRIRKYSNAIAALMFVLSLAAVSLGVVMSIQLTRAPDFNDLHHISHLTVIGSCQAVTFAVTVFIFIILLAFEKPVSSSKTRLAKGLDLIIFVMIEKGGAATAIQTGYMIAFFAAPTNRFWVLFQMVARRMFFLSLLTLYINDGAREKRYITYTSSHQGATTVKMPTDQLNSLGCFQSGDGTLLENRNYSGEDTKRTQMFNVSVIREVQEDFDVLPKKHSQ